MTEVRDIEDLLVWAFREQQVEHFAQGLRPRGPSRNIGSMIAETLVLGTRVDNTTAGARFLGARCHDDAVVIFEAVMALPPEAWVEVIKHARTATRPYWYPEGPGKWVVPRDKWGNPKRIYRDPVRQRGDLGEAPPELIGINPLVVEEARAVYRLWHTSLCELTALVNREMTAHRAVWPTISPEPWFDLVGEKIRAC